MSEAILRNAVLLLVGSAVAAIAVVMVLHYRAATRTRGTGAGLTPWHVAAVSAAQLLLLVVGAVAVVDPLLLPFGVLAGLVGAAAALSLVSLYLIGRRQNRTLSMEVGADSARAESDRRRPGHR